MRACAVCRTDLHLLDGEVDVPDPPRVLGHQIVGEVIEGSGDIAPGARIGVPWLGWTDGTCRFCTTGRENLCVQARFTGRDVDGGYAEYAVVDARYCFAIPDGYPDLQAAPLLCAGLIGFRALRLAGDGERLGLYGFGASAHIICQVAAAEGRRVFAFTRGGDEATQAFTSRATIVTLTSDCSALVRLRNASSSVMSASSLWVTCGIITQLRARFGPLIFWMRVSGRRSTSP